MIPHYALITTLALCTTAGWLGAQNGSSSPPSRFKASEFDTEHCLLYYRGTWKSHQLAFQLELGPDARYEMRTGDGLGQMREERGTVAYEIAAHPEDAPFSRAFSVIPAGAAPVKRDANSGEYSLVEGLPVGPTMLLHLRNEATGKVRTLLVSSVCYRQGVVVQTMVLMVRDPAPGSAPMMLSGNPLQYFPELHVAFSERGAVPQVDVTPEMLVGSWRGADKRWRGAERRGGSHGLLIEEGGRTAIADMSAAEVAGQHLPECVCKKVGNVDIDAQGVPRIRWLQVKGKANEIVGNSTIERLVDQLFAGPDNLDVLDSFEMKRTTTAQPRGGEMRSMHRVVMLHGACESSGVKPCVYEADSSEVAGREE